MSTDPKPAPASSSAPASAPPPPHRPQPVVVYANQPSLLSRFSHWLGWTGFIFCALALIGMYGRFHTYFDTTGGLTERYVSGDKFAQDKVIVLTISGVIMDGDGFVKRQIDRIREDDNAKAVVVRVESPGGTVTGSDFIFHHLKRLREEKKIPLVVSMGSIAASGGYYVSMAVGDEERTIYAEPTTTTGSIGVMMPHYDVSGLMEKLDVKDDTIATHERKTMLSMTKPLAGENRAVVQATINEMFDRFKTVIKEGRPVFRKDPAALDQLATGEVFLAEKAKMHGLVDEIGFIEDAIDRALELAHLSKESTRVVKYRKPESLVDILEGTAAKAPGMDLGAILDLSTPRAYYLFSSFPAAVSTARGE